jgi:uncharacterized protein
MSIWRLSAPVRLATWLVALEFFAAQPVLAADIDKGERTVAVSATGSVKATPDIARLSAGVATEAETARDAFARNGAAMAKLLDGLKQIIVASDIRLVVRDVKRLGEVLDRAAASGANQTYNIRFEVADAERLKDEARKQAMENARRRAELYAKAAGAELGPALRIAETVGDLRFGDSVRFGSGDSVRGFNRGGFGPPIEAGTQDLEVAVQVVYALQ